MTPIRTFEEMVAKLRQSCATHRIAVVCPYDEESAEAALRAMREGFAELIFVGDPMRIAAAMESAGADSRAIRIVEAADAAEAAAKAVEEVRAERADILMKGLIGTDVYLKAILNKEHGLLPAGDVLTHLSVAQMPGYDKLLAFSDVAVIPYPTIEQRRAMLRYDIATLHRLGISKPMVALIHFTEKVNPKFPNSTDYATLVAENARGAFGEAVLGGPMDVKCACNAHSAAVKGIKSEVCGNADLLIFSNIDAGNTFYKTITQFASATVAGILQGPVVPVLLSSRSDSPESKFYSLALACINRGC